MPRYHFDLVDHHIVEDHGGQVLADDITAADGADELARRIYDVRAELRGRFDPDTNALAELSLQTWLIEYHLSIAGPSPSVRAKLSSRQQAGRMRRYDTRG
jgi:hypothetical protein